MSAVSLHIYPDSYDKMVYISYDTILIALNNKSFLDIDDVRNGGRMACKLFQNIHTGINMISYADRISIRV